MSKEDGQGIQTFLQPHRDSDKKIQALKVSPLHMKKGSDAVSVTPCAVSVESDVEEAAPDNNRTNHVEDE